MPMEANAAAVSTVLPSSPTRISEGRTAEGVQGRSGGDASAAFSQQTNVSIETAIDHMADVLSKISGRQQSSVEQMPQELKEVIQNIIKQSFSLETTLGQGLGSTAASQRFSTDQLTTLARMLNQLGALSDAGAAPQVSDDLAVLLTHLKSTIAAETGGTFEPIMLTKAAFQLLDTGNPELLPKELQAFLEQLGAQAQGGDMPAAGASASLRVLDQLVRSLMPRAGGTEAVPAPLQSGAEEAASSAPQQPGAQTADAAAPRMQQQAGQPATAPPQGAQAGPSTEMPAQTSGEGVLPKGGGDPTAIGQQELGTRENHPVGPNMAQTKTSIQQGDVLPASGQFAAEEGAAGQNPVGQGTQTLPSQGQQTQQPQTQQEMQSRQQQGVQQSPEEQTGAAQQQAHLPTEIGGRSESLPSGRENPAAQTAAARPQNATTAELQQGAAKFFSQTMENTPQMMQVMRSAAQFLLYANENLSQREVMLLQNFVSGQNRTLSEGDAKQLQQLIQLAQQNVPGTVRQAAIEQRMPDLPRLWAFMQMADMVTTRKMTAEQYRRAGKNVAALALSMRGALEGENAAPQPGQRSMNFIMPLFMGEAEYPAYIHVYDETHADEESGQVQKETWLRICVLTDHIGTVELINRIYEENHVDMRLYFSDPDAAWEFRSHLDEIRDSANDTPIVIEGIQIGAIGERRFFTN